MENEALIAVNNAKRWYKTAMDAYDDGNYDTCVYSLEMALEIGLKSMLLKFNIEYPKMHDIIPIFKLRTQSLKFSKELDKSLDEMLGTFQLLLKYRNETGYMFSYKTDMVTLKKVAIDSLPKVGGYLKILEDEARK
ncbi:MAG: HEPN domain-containing protein [Candidatus Micrarchaeaceae archaeon]